jgi:hypothetical protein
MFVVLYVAAGVVLGWFKRIITQNIIAQRVNRPWVNFSHALVWLI